MFDDLKDPYQMNNLPIEKNKKLFKSLCKQMPALLKKPTTRGIGNGF